MNTAIEVQKLSFAYKTINVLEDITLNIKEGDFVGLIGPNGGGKTTFLKLIMGLYKPDEGIINLFGKSPKDFTTKIGYVPQVNTFDPLFPITVKELIMLGCISNYKVKGGYPKTSIENAMNAIKLLGLLDQVDKQFGQLSGGMAQRVLIARALASDPLFLFLDEPTANVDTQTKDVIYNVLNSFRKKKTMLMVTHDLNTAVKYVDSIISIEKSATTYLPDKVCEHFSLGLYHTPLVERKNNGNT